MFEMTLETLNKENLEKFLLNMDIDESFGRADKTLEEAKYELKYFKDNYKTIPNYINFYYIGKMIELFLQVRLKNIVKIII